MTFTAAGMKRLTHIGAIGTGGASVRSLWSYVTNDDAATLETANYFDEFLSEFRLGDQIIASIDLDGTPTIRVYVVTSVTSHVTISRETTVVAGDQAAIADFAAPTDSPATADALRDDLTTNWLPKLNLILTRLRSAGLLVP